LTPLIAFTAAGLDATIVGLEMVGRAKRSAMADIPGRRRRWVLPAALVVVGVAMMVVGSFGDGYASQVWLQLGSAFALFGPLFWAQKRLERGITEVRRQGHETRSSVEQLSHEVEAIREETAATLDDLREVTLGHLRERRRTDEDAFRRFQEDPTFENVTRLLERARQLGGISRRGVRVRLPGTDFRLRFPVPAEPGNGGPPVLEVGLEEEDGTRPQDAAAPRVPARGQLPVPWSAGQSASEWAASMAAALQALNRYPGDEQFDPSGALEQLTGLLRLAVETRTRPTPETGAMPRLRPIIELPNDEWAITEDGLQSLRSGDAFTVEQLFSATTEEAAGARLEGDGAVKLREAWRLGQRLFLSPGTVL
jgi:hypothetical protein